MKVLIGNAELLPYLQAGGVDETEQVRAGMAGLGLQAPAVGDVDLNGGPGTVAGGAYATGDEVAAIGFLGDLPLERKRGAQPAGIAGLRRRLGKPVPGRQIERKVVILKQVLD